MKRFVLDCSVFAAWCLKDESNREADRHLDALATGENMLPALWIVEMTNVIVVAERRIRVTPNDAKLALELLDQLPIVVDRDEIQMMDRLYELTIEQGIAAYDAAYLEIAKRHRLPLASLDQRQTTSAETARIRLL